MKACPNCQSKYPDDANFCPQETCATPEGPRRLTPIQVAVPASRFTALSRLGGSRSGEVFRAQDSQTGTEVAYKLVASAALPTAAALERAQRELKQLQRAQSPRLARVIDFGKSADGRFYVASELVAGQPLDRLVAQGGPLPLDRAKKIVAQLGEALLEGQKVGVVHHDLAAKNVLVGAGDDVKLINFVTPWPVTETVFGVPQYLAPEQAEGKLVDQRSNTYSLGALLMLMLTGEPPVDGADPRAVLAEVVRGEIAPPSRRRPGLGPDIDRVVMKALEKSSSRRPLTMRQFLTEVAGLTGAPAAAATAPVAAPPREGAAFAKTMMFTGGPPPELQKLVSQAAAARAEANGSGPVAQAAPQPAPAYAPPPIVPGPSPFAPSATPPPTGSGPALSPAAAAMPRRSHGAAIAATMIAMPAANVGPMPGSGPRPLPSPDPAMQPTPPPLAAMQATPPPVAAAGSGGPPAGGSTSATKTAAGTGNFRETLWFKKGDVEQMVAEARAKAVAGREVAPVADELPAEEAKPLEDRYVDDGSVTVEDRKKFSLRAGGGTASALPPVAGGFVPGERMSESEVLDEIGGRRKMVIAGVAVAVAVVVVAVAFVLLRGGGDKNARSMAPLEKPAAAAVPPPAPPAPAEAVPPAPAEGAAAAVAPSPAGGDNAPLAKADVAPPKAAAHPSASARKRLAKKHAGKKKPR